MAPAAAIVLFGLALIYRDGALVIVAVIAAILSLVVDALIVGSGVLALSLRALLARALAKDKRARRIAPTGP